MSLFEPLSRCNDLLSVNRVAKRPNSVALGHLNASADICQSVIGPVSRERDSQGVCRLKSPEIPTDSKAEHKEVSTVESSDLALGGTISSPRNSRRQLNGNGVFFEGPLAWY